MAMIYGFEKWLNGKAETVAVILHGWSGVSGNAETSNWSN